MATAKQLAALAKARSARKAYAKGTRSTTMPGRLDFTTKKTSKDFHRGGRLQQTAIGSNVRRRPFAKKTASPEMRAMMAAVRAMMKPKTNKKR